MSIAVRVRVLLASARRNPQGDAEQTLTLPEGATVRTVLDRFEIPETQTMIILRNDAQAGLEEELASGDALTIVPPLDGG